MTNKKTGLFITMCQPPPPSWSKTLTWSRTSPGLSLQLNLFFQPHRSCNSISMNYFDISFISTRDALHKYAVDFYTQCETSKQKLNFINKKLGNHKQGFNVSEIERDWAKAVDIQAICNAFTKSFAEMVKYSGDFVRLNVHKLDHCAEKINFRALTSTKPLTV